MQKTDSKVKAASAGAGGGAVLAGLVLWALAEYVFVDGVPAEVSAAVVAVVPAALAWAAGYLRPARPGGKHRRDEAATPSSEAGA